MGSRDGFRPVGRLGGLCRIGLRGVPLWESERLVSDIVVRSIVLRVLTQLSMMPCVYTLYGGLSLSIRGQRGLVFGLPLQIPPPLLARPDVLHAFSANKKSVDLDIWMGSGFRSYYRSNRTRLRGLDGGHNF